MKRLTILLILLTISLTAFGQTGIVTGTLQDLHGLTAVGTVFTVSPEPKGTVLANGNSVVLSAPFNWTNDATGFAFPVLPGHYSADFGPPNKPIKFNVPGPGPVSFAYCAGLAQLQDVANASGVDASKITSGTLDPARLPSSVVQSATPITATEANYLHGIYSLAVCQPTGPPLDFNQPLQTISAGGNISLTSSMNIGIGKTVVVLIAPQTSSRTLTLKSSWTFLGAAPPSSLAANKLAILTLTGFATSDTAPGSVVAGFSAQP